MRDKDKWGGMMTSSGKIWQLRVFEKEDRESGQQIHLAVQNCVQDQFPFTVGDLVN